MEKKQTAILVFAKTALEELNGKQLFGNDRIRMIRLFQKLNRKVCSTARSTGLPFYVFNGSKQKGKNFQERYYNAIKVLFQAGYEEVICIGNDSPELTSNDLLSTATLLKKNDLVFGKTDRGGVYTLAFTRKGFENFQFNRVAWNTKDVFDLIADYAGRSGIDFSVLSPVYREINEEKDLIAFLNSLKKNVRRIRIYGDLFGFPVLNYDFELYDLPIIPERYSRSLLLRGPPASAA